MTEFSPAAMAQLGKWDTRIDDDYAAWLAARQPTNPPVPDRHAAQGRSSASIGEGGVTAASKGCERCPPIAARMRRTYWRVSA